MLVDMPDSLSLEHLRGTGPQQGEELQPDEPSGQGTAAGAGGPDKEVVAQLVAMGFSEAGSCRAAVATDNAGEHQSREIACREERTRHGMLRGECAFWVRA